MNYLALFSDEPTSTSALLPIAAASTSSRRVWWPPRGVRVAAAQSDQGRVVRPQPSEEVAPELEHLPHTVPYGGERFSVSICEGNVLLAHPRWSLVGMGSDLFAAEVDLRSEAWDFYLVMADDDPMELSQEAERFRQFLIRLFR